MSSVDLDFAHDAASVNSLRGERCARPASGELQQSLRPRRGILFSLVLSLLLWMCVLFAWLVF